jgi:hypothetical protein
MLPYYAGRSGNLELVLENLNGFTIGQIAEGAAEEGHINILTYLFKNYNISDVTKLKIFLTASYGGHKNLLEILITECSDININEGLKYALYGNHYELIDFFIEKGSSIENLPKSLIKKCNGFIKVPEMRCEGPCEGPQPGLCEGPQPGLCEGPQPGPQPVPLPKSCEEPLPKSCEEPLPVPLPKSCEEPCEYGFEII